MRSLVLGVAIGVCLGTAAMAGETSPAKRLSFASVKNPMIVSPTWEVLREEMLDDRAALDGEHLLILDAPPTAFEAAAVPFSIRQRKGTGQRITHMKIVIDENPAPLAAEFELGPLMGDVYLESRVRYDQPSNIRVIAETEEGKTFMIGRFVQAAGGCAAAATRDLTAALDNMGEMKLKQFARRGGTAMASGQVRQAQLMIRHPNFTGMQASPTSGEIIDARFVDDVEVRLGSELLFRMTGGFSISENPTFRFTYIDNGAQAMTVRATDTSGAVFQQVLPLSPGA